MEGIIAIVHGVAKFVAVFGGAMAAVFVVYSGIQWMTAAGDPQKMAMARNGLIGCVVGLVIIGMGISVPGILSRWIIEPAGGVAIEAHLGINCDQILRDQLIFQNSAGSPFRMQQVIGQIQAQNNDCSSDVWSPYVKNYLYVDTLTNYDSGVPPGCFDAVQEKVGDLGIPASLFVGAGLPINSRRDTVGNILVYWQHPDFVSDPRLREGAPSDNSVCWLYVDSLDVWSEGYPN